MATDSDLVVSTNPSDFGFPESPTVYEVKRWVLQERFLAAYPENDGAIYKSAAAAGCSAMSHENWLREDSFGYQKRFTAAQMRYLELMEIEADRRGVKGVDKPIVHLGVITDTYKVYSDNLLMFRMKKLDHSYRDNYNIVIDERDVKGLLDAMRDAGTPRTVDGTARVVPNGDESLPSATIPDNDNRHKSDDNQRN